MSKGNLFFYNSVPIANRNKLSMLLGEDGQDILDFLKDNDFKVRLFNERLFNFRTMRFCGDDFHEKWDSSNSFLTNDEIVYIIEYIEELIDGNEELSSKFRTFNKTNYNILFGKVILFLLLCSIIISLF